MLANERIGAAINAAVAKGHPALVGYLTAGFPSRRQFKENLAAVARGCDVVEIGVGREPVGRIDHFVKRYARNRKIVSRLTYGAIDCHMIIRNDEPDSCRLVGGETLDAARKATGIGRRRIRSACRRCIAIFAPANVCRERSGLRCRCVA